MALPKFKMLKKLISLGISEDLTQYEKNQYLLINIIIYISILTKTIGTIFAGISSTIILTGAQTTQASVTIILNFVMLYYNSKGKIQVSKYILVVLVYLGLFAIIFIFRVDSYSQTLLMVSLFSFLTIILESRKQLLRFTLIAVAVFIIGLINQNYDFIQPIVVYGKSETTTIRFTAIFVIIFTLAYTIYLKSYAVTHQEELNEALTTIESKNNLLDKNLKEKELLLSETHHRVKNNLQLIISLLELQLNTINDDKNANILKVSIGRINSMSAIHKKLYQHEENFEHINLAVYLKELTNYIVGLYPKKETPISTSFTLEDCYLTIDKSIPLGLIMNEIITNAVKYGVIENQENTFTLSLDTADDGLVIIFKDSGKGLPENKEEGLGTKVVTMLTRQIQGTVDYKNENGLQVKLTV